MALFTVHRLLLNEKLSLHNRTNYCPNHSTSDLFRLANLPFPFLPSGPLAGRNPVARRVHSFNPWNSPRKPLKKQLNLEPLLLFVFIVILLCIRLLFAVLPPDFPQRWRRLIAFSEEADARASNYPSHLWQAVVASEDRRFFRHCGIDHVGIARAVLSFSAGGGGSTITQQLVKNTFLKTERTFSRKLVEMVLALVLERTMSKWKILNSYLSKIYWGHGIYGIELASTFYYGKHPSLLSLGESAMLAGIIPSPELRSPFRDLSRGKTSQARALRRMVEAGFLDIDTALLTVNQPLHLHVDGPEGANGLLHSLSFFDEEPWDSSKQGSRTSIIREIWDWEKESNIWEVREAMERWALRIRRRKLAIIPVGKSN